MNFRCRSWILPCPLVTMLEPGHWLQAQVYTAAMQLAEQVSRMKDLPAGTDAPALECDAVRPRQWQAQILPPAVCG